MNYLLMAIGQVFEALAFFAAIPTTILTSLAQMFYMAGSVDNNNEENGDE